MKTARREHSGERHQRGEVERYAVGKAGGGPLFDQPDERGLVLERFPFHVYLERYQVAL